VKAGCLKTLLLLWFSRDSVGELMKPFVAEVDRGQWTLLPECLDDFIDESNPVRVIDVFVDTLDLAEMYFEGAEPAATGRTTL
jgi:transposase